MAIEDIFRALDEQAEAECGDILRSAREQADAILAEAKLEADRIKQERIEAAEAFARHRAAQTLNSARLENRKDMAAVRDRSIAQVFEVAHERLAHVRDGASYESVIRSLAAEAAPVVEARGSSTLLVAPADADVGKRVASEHGWDLDPTLDAIGGVVVSTAKGRVIVRNTFEDRLAKVRRNAQSHVAEMLFE